MSSDIKKTLSITLLSSGKKDLIKKCLDSMEALRKAIPSELIIVDTSGDADTRKLIESYADQVVDFKWCDDFSKARNAGLEKASGDWFMFIDDDEWFVDTKEIEEFFITKEYKIYGFADYRVRSFTSADNSTYKDGRVSRLYELRPDTRFRSPIHEYINSQGKCKFLSKTIANHTGYFFPDNDALFAKVRRNAPMLEKAIKEDPGNPRWYCQQSSEMYSCMDYYRSELSARQGLKAIGDKTDYDSSRFRGALYVSVLKNLIKGGKIEEAHSFLEEIGNVDNVIPMAQATIIGEAAKIEHRRKEYDKALTYAREFFRLKEIIENNDELLYTGTPFLTEGLDVKNAAVVNNVAQSCCLNTDDYEGFVENFNKVRLNDREVYLDDDLIEDILNAIERWEDPLIILPQIESLIKRKGVYNLFVEHISKREEKDKFYKIENVFFKIHNTNSYIEHLKILRNLEKNDYNAVEIIVSAMNTEEWEECIHYLINGEKLKATLEDCMNSIADTEKFLYYRVRKEEKEIYEVASNGDKDAETDIMIKRDITYNDYSHRVRSYCEDTIKYARLFFTNKCFCGDYPRIPGEIRAAIHILEAIELMDKGKIADASAPFKKAIEYNPRLSDISKKLTQLLSKQTKPELTPEMEQLSRSLKEKIREMLSMGMEKEAFDTAMQLKQLIGEDSELTNLIEGFK